jgi:hypothetical protein
MGHRYDEAERSWIASARDVEELLARGHDHLVIEVDLIGARAGTGLDDRVHAVIPARALIESSPIGRPAEIGWVDVGGETILKTMQLIGPAEMHLAAQRRLVARMAQIVGKGRHLRGKLRRVVVGADFRGPLSGEE